MSTVKNGTDLLLTVEGNAVAHAKSHTLSVSGNVIDYSSKTSGDWTEKMAGRLSWTVSTDGLLSYDATNGKYSDLFALMIARTSVTLVIDNEEKTYTGEAIISSLEQSAPDDDNATFSVSFEGTGALAEAAGA
jgi:TP901-1 family phage major tail protein